MVRWPIIENARANLSFSKYLLILLMSPPPHWSLVNIMEYTPHKYNFGVNLTLNAKFLSYYDLRMVYFIMRQKPSLIFSQLSSTPTTL